MSAPFDLCRLQCWAFYSSRGSRSCPLLSQAGRKDTCLELGPASDHSFWTLSPHCGSLAMWADSAPARTRAGVHFSVGKGPSGGKRGAGRAGVRRLWGSLDCGLAASNSTDGCFTFPGSQASSLFPHRRGSRCSEPCSPWVALAADVDSPCLRAHSPSAGPGAQGSALGRATCPSRPEHPHLSPLVARLFTQQMVVRNLFPEVLGTIVCLPCAERHPPPQPQPPGRAVGLSVSPTLRPRVCLLLTCASAHHRHHTHVPTLTLTSKGSPPSPHSSRTSLEQAGLISARDPQPPHLVVPPQPAPRPPRALSCVPRQVASPGACCPRPASGAGIQAL